MKKMVLMVIVGLFVYGQIFAQSEQPIMGYDRVAWGASVLDVRRVYNLGNSVALQENYENTPDVAALIQRNISDSIKERMFLFNKWKGSYQLYRVWVEYLDTSESTIQNLQNLLALRFGKITGYDNSNPTIYTYGQYSPELIVELIRTTEIRIYTIDSSGRKIYEENPNMAQVFTSGRHYMENRYKLQVCYTWERFRNEYRARGIGL